MKPGLLPFDIVLLNGLAFRLFVPDELSQADIETIKKFINIILESRLKPIGGREHSEDGVAPCVERA